MKKITLLMVSILMTFITHAQWNSDTATNLLLADLTTGTIESVTTSNGNTYTLIWSEVPSPANYELRIQKTDALGNIQFGDQGALISDTLPMSSFTQVSSLTTDANENIYVGVTATNGNGGYAFKLDSNGNHLWDSNGISLGVGYIVRLLPLASGETIITWLSGSFNGTIQKFDTSGNSLWTNPVELGSGTVPANSYELSNGSITIVYHVLLSGITSRLYAQNIDTNGNTQWATPPQLFANGNNTAYNVKYSGLQDGDVIYMSYKLAHDNRFDAYVQRINADGTLPWGITGVDFDTNQTDYEQEIQIAMSPGSQNLFALCRYTGSGQGDSGIFLQKFDKETGARQLTDNAKEIYAISNNVSPIGDFRLSQDQPVFLTVEGNELNINLLDSNGDFVWTEQSKPIATYAAGKSHVNLNKISNAELVATFTEDRGSGEQAYAQNFTDNALSVSDFDTENSLQFINPIHEILTLKSERELKSVYVYNALGQLVSKSQNIHSNKATIDAQNWSRGLYLVTIKTVQNQMQNLKIIKK
ncbi:T9SS type A sorting domain-containing protein [Psychroserpens sp. SPM9]|uniref:T9SS type A sorting domain-containing protein n=1 Tax=Psychroserpens sp. SPM9 TaxID=2975598 RepID=UPI0021A373AA|nr:T9SS type A sorting domain-containing protein [Psychroserpens sp. SPM9]MDG5490720.1 T9SS type A sorting domain-containing protein [Psychroserpens sp. SPM9]